MIVIWQNEHPMVSAKLNKTFHEVRMMSKPGFARWAEDVRQYLGECAEQGIPTHNGTSLAEVESDLRKLAAHSTNSIFQIDSETYAKEIIVPDARCGAFLRCIFTNMQLSGDGNFNGRSIVDFLADATLATRWADLFERNVKRDSLYVFSSVLRTGQPLDLGAEDGREWIDLFRERYGAELEFWAEAVEAAPKSGELSLSPSELDSLRRSGVIASKQIVNVIGARTKSYRLRTYHRSDRIFPTYFSIIRKSLVMAGSNFSPLIAKGLYHHFTEHLREQGREIIIFDPSAGYGGRCLGALAASNDRPIRYIGTDPNSTNWLSINRSRYDEVADLYRATISQKYETAISVFQLGSEVIDERPEFQRYRGKIDLVFTSPPYFRAEIYCKEATQSAIKFRTYPEWREGFLRRTLKTCADYLRPGGYILWNIADISIKGKYVPLEQDSIQALTEFGLIYERKLKMLLSTGPGACRTEQGMPVTKNSVMHNGKLRKYEPIFVFRKPHVH